MTDYNTYISDTGVLYIDSDDRYWTDYYDSQPHWAKQQKESDRKGESMTDCNAKTYVNSGSYYDGSVVIYTDSDTSGDYWVGHNYYPRREPPPVTVITKVVEVPAQENSRKENDMIKRQTFLDALADEGKSIGSEGREIIKEAEADKWELFIARLLARAFDDVDLAMLKEKPKEVLIKEA